MALKVHHALRKLLARLPFNLYDADQINRTFCCWIKERQDTDRQIIDLWTYCYVRNYLSFKFIQHPPIGVADFDLLLEQILNKVNSKRSQLDDKSRYASWVSVVCKNTYINYLRSKKRMVYLESLPTYQVGERPNSFGELSFLLNNLEKAIARLPIYLQEVAYLHFVKGLPYPDIHEETGKSLPTIRSYVYKTIRRFRKDSVLKAYIIELTENKMKNPDRRRIDGVAEISTEDDDPGQTSNDELDDF